MAQSDDIRDVIRNLSNDDLFRFGEEISSELRRRYTKIKIVFGVRSPSEKAAAIKELRRLCAQRLSLKDVKDLYETHRTNPCAIVVSYLEVRSFLDEFRKYVDSVEIVADP